MRPEIKAAYERVWAVERERDELIANTYAIGDTIGYSHGDNVIEAEIVMHGGARLLVRGRSGKEYWVDAFRLVA